VLATNGKMILGNLKNMKFRKSFWVQSKKNVFNIFFNFLANFVDTLTEDLKEAGDWWTTYYFVFFFGTCVSVH